MRARRRTSGTALVGAIAIAAAGAGPVAQPGPDCFVLHDEICGRFDDAEVALPVVDPSLRLRRNLKAFAQQTLLDGADREEERVALEGLLQHFDHQDGLISPPAGAEVLRVEEQQRVWVVPLTAFPADYFRRVGSSTAFSGGIAPGVGVLFYPDRASTEPILVTDMLIARARGGDCTALLAGARQLGLEAVKRLPGKACTYRLRAPGPGGRHTVRAARRLGSLAEVEFAHPDVQQTVRLLQDSEDARLAAAPAWHLKNTAQPGADINVAGAWRYTRGSPETIIAVLDGGFNPGHPDLNSRVLVNEPEHFGTRHFDDDGNGLVDDVMGWNFGKDSGDVSLGADPRHGQAIAGLAVAPANGLGIVGVCPECRVLLVTVGSDHTWYEALYYARQRGADVIVMALGIAEDRTDLSAALSEVGAEVPVFAATGNEGPSNRIFFPARSPKVLGVGGSDCRDRMFAGQHSGGGEIGVVAPTRQDPSVAGEDCGLMTLDLESYRPQFGGTSGASALVAGVAGLLLSRNPELTPEQVYTLLRQSADKIDRPHAKYDDKGYSPECGFGRVNAGRAMQLLVER